VWFGMAVVVRKTLAFLSFFPCHPAPCESFPELNPPGSQIPQQPGKLALQSSPRPSHATRKRSVTPSAVRLRVRTISIQEFPGTDAKSQVLETLLYRVYQALTLTNEVLDFINTPGDCVWQLLELPCTSFL
jgi:hypothetical protein